jgi:hypothetical protein
LKPGLCSEWFEDFWSFVECVGEKPVGFTLRRSDRTKPLSPENWRWQESIDNSDSTKYQREWNKRNPERSKHHNLKRSYGITLDQYNGMGDAQQWLCAICGCKETTKDKDGGPRQMPVDHDHKTGKVRALLCTQCNRGLGMFSDSPDKLQAALEYLRKHS